jgi:hypothetical protein
MTDAEKAILDREADLYRQPKTDRRDAWERECDEENR